jgi:DNA (cytosine-5)-methyltransferase 1
VDSDGHHVATHERNFPYGKAVCASVVDLTSDKIRSLIGTNEDIDLVFGGPPCQGFSHMGLRDLKDPRNSLIDHYVRLVLEIRPKVFVMENVPGLLSGKTKAILDQMILLASDSGYNITQPVQILDAADFGVPQQRRRVFVLGVRKDVANAIPYPRGKAALQPERPTVLEAIADLPRVDKYEELFEGDEIPYDAEPKSTYARVARGVDADPTDLSRPRVWNRQICTGCLRTRHSAKSVQLYAATPPGDTVPGHKLPRLDPNGICSTLRAGSDSTHGSYTAPRPIHPVYPRCITTREAARLHGFPDWFTFYPLKWHGARQIGNAVCPPVARAIGHSIMQILLPPMTTKAPKPIPLPETFILPEDRPRTLKRIPQLQEFPPVLAHIFDQAFDSKRKCLRRKTFTFAHVEEAIRSTNANLHWVREETFLPEIARSRSVLEILAPIRRHGFSIQPTNERGAIGKFVPIGTPGTLEDKESLQIRINEIHDAKSIRFPSFDQSANGEVLEKFLSEPAVQQGIWGRKRGAVTVETISNGTGRANGAVVQRIRASKSQGSCVVLKCRAATLPNKARISRIAEDYECSDVLLVISATSRHVVAVRFSDCKTHPKEAVRVAFELA